jgi:23S rRNA pseudouridine2605 synthase
MKLARFISLAGRGSRRAAEGLIREGRVALNGVVVRDVATRVDTQKDSILVDGVPAKPPSRFTYMLLHKPAGYVCSTRPSGSLEPIYNLLPRRFSRKLKYAGRLDADSEGLVLLTDDGELIYRLTHPRFKQPKIYLVKVDRVPGRKALEELARGVLLEDGRTLPAVVSEAGGERGPRWVHIEITEGRKRQVRRMCEAVGLKVGRLVRMGIANLRLGELESGKARALTGRETRDLLRSVGIVRPGLA